MYETPVLGANIGGIPELIRVGETGELFESGNRKELASKVEYMWNNAETFRKVAVDFFSTELYVKTMMRHYGRITGA